MPDFRRDGVRAAALAALASGIVLVGNVALSTIVPIPPHGPSQRSGFVVAGCIFAGVAAVLWRASRTLPNVSPSDARMKVVNILLVGYLLGVLLPGIRFFAGEQNLGWTLISSAAVIMASAAVALLSTRRNGASRG